MKKVLIILGVIVGILGIITFSIFGWVKNNYNTIVTMDEEINGAWAQVENVLQRRYDLIPNLVETVKGYASHESGVFIQVTEARSKVAGAGSPVARMGAEGELSSALSRLMVVVENYPQLKANQNFVMLQDQLESTENRIAVERGRYNNTVKIFNQYIRRFPASMLAGMFNYNRRDFFEAPEAAQTVPQVKFE